MNRLQDKILVALGAIIVPAVIWLVSSTSQNETKLAVIQESTRQTEAVMGRAVDYMEKYTPVIIENRERIRAIERKGK